MTRARIAAGCTFAIGDGSNNSGTSNVQTLTVTGTAGTFILGATVGFNLGVQPNAVMLTGPLPYNITLLALQTAINALPNVGLNAAEQPNILVGGTVGAYTLTAQNDLANRPINLFTANGAGLTGGTATIANTTPGVAAGQVFSTIAELTTLPTPQVKRAKKEATNFDSLGVTKEFVPEFIDPGDVKMDFNYVGDSSQDYITGLIAKFNAGLTYTCMINFPHYQIGPGVMAYGHREVFSGFFTDAAINNAKVNDLLMLTGTLGITGAVTYLKPLN